jgi:hypothetical protein
MDRLAEIFPPLTFNAKLFFYIYIYIYAVLMLNAHVDAKLFL